MMGLWKVFNRGRAQSIVEYAVILALVALVAILSLTLMGGRSANAVGNLGNSMAEEEEDNGEAEEEEDSGGGCGAAVVHY